VRAPAQDRCVTEWTWRFVKTEGASWAGDSKTVLVARFVLVLEKQTGPSNDARSTGRTLPESGRPGGTRVTNRVGPAPEPA